jgi:hypothetical protein
MAKVDARFRAAVLFDVTSQPDRVFLDAAGDDPQRPVRQRPCSLRASTGGAVIQVSTSSGVVRITGMAFG